MASPKSAIPSEEVRTAGKLKLKAQLELGGEIALGPGKVALIEKIAETGSISAAARAMGMSYRRAWLLVDTLNRCFRDPVIEAHAGQGAGVTPLGHALIAAYHRLMVSMQPQSDDPDMQTIEHSLRAEPLARADSAKGCP